MNLLEQFNSYIYKNKVATRVVRLKLFRLKAEGVRKTRLQYFGGM